jgi:hypothetical protein
MRISALTLFALATCAAFPLRAEDAAPVTPPAIEQPSAAAKGSTEPAPTPALENKGDKQLSTETKAANSNSGRFGFERTDDGFLRFDYQTGQVAFCNARPDGWGCQPVPENRAVLERELEQLRAEVADLKTRLKAITDPPRPVPPETVPPSKAPKASPPDTNRTGDTTFSIPGREHIARAATAVHDAWQRFVDLVSGLTNDIRRKTGA